MSLSRDMWGLVVKGGDTRGHTPELSQSQHGAVLLCDVAHLLSSCDMLQTTEIKSQKR